MTLARLCPHNQITEHPCLDGKPVSQSRLQRITDEERPRLSMCPGGSLLPPDSLVIVKEDGNWPEWCYRGATKQFLDALAAAQHKED